MTGYKKILFPTDFSESSKHVLVHLKEMAKKFNAEIHAIYVAHVEAYYSSIQIPTTGIASFEGEIITAAEKQLDDLVKNELGEFKVIGKVLSGNPPDTILDYASEQGIDLIMMGHSRSGLERVLLGSTAHRIVKLSNIPVMVIRPPE